MSAQLKEHPNIVGRQNQGDGSTFASGFCILDNQTPFDSISAMLAPELCGIRASRLRILNGLDILSQLKIPVSGSISWMLQTGLTIDEAISLAKDIDGVSQESTEYGITLHANIIDEVMYFLQVGRRE